MDLSTLNTVPISDHFNVVSAKEVSESLLIAWRRAYRIEALGAAEGRVLEKQVSEDVDQWLHKNDCWILLSNRIPVSLSAFNARLEDRVSVEPVWTPPEHRNQGFARVLLAYTLDLEKRKGTQKAVLFTQNPAAIKAYLFIGFKKIADYRVALLNKPSNLKNLIEFTDCPRTSDIDF